MSDLSGGGDITYWDYFGTIAGLVCVGPVDKLVEVVLDGKRAWLGPVSREGQPNPLEITLDDDPRRVIRFYWGTEDQTPDPRLPEGTPAWPGLCYVVLDDFYFGREQPSVNSLKIVVERKADTAGLIGDLAPGSQSCSSVAAEILTHPRHGLALDPAGLDAAALESLHESQSASVVDLIDGLWTMQQSVRGVLSELTDHSGQWLRYDSPGDLWTAGQSPWHRDQVDLESLPVLTFEDMTERPQLNGDGWSNIDTGWMVTFFDRVRGWKESSEKWDDARAGHVTGEHRRQTLARPHVITREKARALAQRQAMRRGLPGLTLELEIRRVKGLGIRPGDLVKVDIEPMPGGMQWLQVCMVLERSIPVHGPIRLRLEALRALMPPVVQTPEVDAVSAGVAVAHPEIAAWRVIPVPPLFAEGEPERLAVVAARPAELVSGADVYYDTDGGGSFPQKVGSLPGFGIRGQVAVGVAQSTADPGPFTVQLTSPLDRHLLTDDPGDIMARDNSLLAIFIKLDGVQIATDPDGYPEMEFMSVRALRLVGEDLWEIDVFRQIGGSRARAFSVGDEVWLVPRASVGLLTHRDFPRAASDASPLWFVVAPFSRWGRRLPADCLPRVFQFPPRLYYLPRITLLEPAESPLVLSDAPGTLPLRALVEDSDGNLSGIAVTLQHNDSAPVSVLSDDLPGVGEAGLAADLAIDSSGLWTARLIGTDSGGLQASVDLVVEVLPSGGQVAPVTFSPPSGPKSGGSVSVQLACSTQGASIFYAVMPLGSAPPPWPDGWDVYSSAFGASVPCMVFARATKADHFDSPITATVFYLRAF